MNEMETCDACDGRSDAGICGLCGTAGQVTKAQNDEYLARHSGMTVMRVSPKGRSVTPAPGQEDPASVKMKALEERIAFLESLVVCRQCEGSGEFVHRHLGKQRCLHCNGSGISYRILNED